MTLHILLSVVKKQNQTNNPKPHDITSLQKGFPHISVVAVQRFNEANHSDLFSCLLNKPYVAKP